MTKKLKDVGLTEQVYGELKHDIISGHYQPGEKITISSLAAALGVSPTPVREAIRLLIAEGGLDLKPNHSVTVAALTADAYEEVARIRMELEGMAASEAARRRTERQLRSFIETNRKLETARKAGRFETVLQHNRAFHFALVEMASMPILAAVLETLWLRSGPLLNLLYEYQYRKPIKDHPHDQLVRAIRDGDAARASKAIRRDIELGTHVIVEHLRSREEAGADLRQRA